MSEEQNERQGMITVVVSPRGQITIPAKLRKELGIRPHDRLTMISVGNTIVMERIPNLLDLKGFLGTSPTDEEEREGMEKAAIEHALGLGE
jgi:AbrB family looped-hinge helix DNA binding protein